MVSICLNMIVKNESHIIEETLAMLSKYIDYWVITDTGSSDNTMKIIQEFFQKTNIPGELHEDKWEDFGTNRTKSLERAYMTLGSIREMRLSFYFGIKENVLFYGFFNEDNSYVYLVGKFEITPKDLKTISKKKCVKTIRIILENSNLKNLKLLQLINVDFHTLFEDVENDVEILDEYRIKNTFPIEILKEEDREENKLSIYLTQWSRNFKWTDKCYYFVHVTEKYAHFYIKIKSIIQ